VVTWLGPNGSDTVKPSCFGYVRRFRPLFAGLTPAEAVNFKINHLKDMPGFALPRPRSILSFSAIDSVQLAFFLTTRDSKASPHRADPRFLAAWRFARQDRRARRTGVNLCGRGYGTEARRFRAGRR